MAEIVNLRRARKAKAKAEASHAAARNRVVHGQSRVEKEKLETSQRSAERRLDGHLLRPQDGK